MTLRPAEADSGIRFRRVDLAGGGALIPARWDRVVETRLCTTLGNADGASLATVEHLMAAFAGCGIDNAEVEVNGPEVPVMDGSSEPFVFLIECAGIRDLGVPRRAIRILEPISVEAEGRSATLLPGEGFEIDCEIDFDSLAVSRQAISVGLVNGTFKKELARARTFGFLHEVEQLWAVGLARGGSLKNAVVVSGDKILNREGLRYEDEFVRHKALDALGDLYLAGSPIIGRFRGLCSGHHLNNLLLHALFAERKAWRYDVFRTDVVQRTAAPRIWRESGEADLAATA
jgi:UDP-3-O-[3-hydroxymyristoyl] N-acetylglucosamine deacetylase